MIMCCLLIKMSRKRLKSFIYYQNQSFIIKMDSIFAQVALESCPACLLNFNSKQVIPMLVCSEQHLCCQECLNKSLKRDYIFKCPLCRQTIFNKQKIKKFRFFQFFQNKINQIKNILQTKYNNERNAQIALVSLKQRQMKEDFQSKIQEKGVDQKKVINNLVEQAKLLFKFSRFKDASRILQIIIERNPQDEEGEFFGLGSYEESDGYYESNVYEWFERKYGQRKVSVYDLLALCYLCQPNYEAQKNWYEGMAKKHPNNIKLIYGLAITQHNADKLEEASRIYMNLIQLNPLFPKPYELLGFIFSTKNQPQKSLKYASECLLIDPQNMYAKFLVGRYKLRNNQNNIQAIQVILKTHGQEKEYVRPLCDLGGYYFFKNNSQCLNYLDKCISINPFSLAPQILKGIYQISVIKQYKTGIQMLEKVLIKDKLAKKQKQIIYKWLGHAYYEIGVWNKSNNYLQIFYSHKDYQKQINVFSAYAYSYYRLKNMEKAINICQQALAKYPNNKQLCEKCYKIVIQINYKQKKYQLVLKNIFEYIEKAYKHNEKYFYYLAKCYLQKQNFEQSEKWCKYCLQKNIEVFKVKICMMEVLSKKSEDKEALKIGLQCMEGFKMDQVQNQTLGYLITKIGKNIKSKKQMLKEKKQQKEREKEKHWLK